MTDNTIEARLRRLLAKEGYALRKTPARSHLREAYGVGYMIVEAGRNIPVSGYTPHLYSDTLEDVAAFVAG
ncbi:MAG: hypothetical protein ACXIVE_05860 [Salinarimonas sp.]